MARSYWALVRDPEVESARKRGLKGLGALEEKPLPQELRVQGSHADEIDA